MKLALALALVGLGITSPLVAAAPSTGDGQATQSQAPIIDRDRSDRAAPSLPAAPAVQAPRPAFSVGAPAAAVGLNEIRLLGSSLPGSMIEPVTARYRRQQLTADVLKAIAEAIGHVYANSDIAFYSVAIPAQRLANGVLTVQVVEGAVTEYSIKGLDEGARLGLVKAHIARIMRSTPLRKSVLQRGLSLLRDMPGQTVEASVRQLDGRGSLALDLTLKRRPMTVGVTIDNNGVSNVTTALQAQMTVTANNLLREGDTTRVSGYLPFYPDRYQFYSLSHTTPIGSNGLSLTGNVARIQTSSRDATVGTIDGEATLAGLSLSYPVVRSYQTSLAVSLSLDGIDSSNYYLDTRFGDYRSRAVRLGTSYSHQNEKRGYGVTMVVSRGLDAFDAKAYTGFSEKDFTKVNGQAVVINALTKTLVAKVTANVQYSRDKLPVTERLSLGGQGSGRAFRVGSVTVDRGAAGMAELSWTPPALKLLQGSALFAFIDGGVGRTEARPYYGLPVSKFSLASAGGGVRLQVGKWRAGVEIAVPIDRPDGRYRREPRLFGSFGRNF